MRDVLGRCVTVVCGILAVGGVIWLTGVGIQVVDGYEAEIRRLNGEISKLKKEQRLVIVAWDDGSIPKMENGKDIVVMKIGEKRILPKWFTTHPNQMISSDKIQEEWLKGSPGVYRIIYLPDPVD